MADQIRVKVCISKNIVNNTFSVYALLTIFEHVRVQTFSIDV